jgi:hypothetical protein
MKTSLPKACSWFVACGWAVLGCSASTQASGAARDANDSGVQPETGSPPEGGTADDRREASADADIEAIPCDKLQSAWNAFLQQSRTCRSDSDCTVFRVYDDAGGRLTTCDRPLGLEASLNVAYVARAQRYADRYFSAECHVDPLSSEALRHWTSFGWDGWGMRDPKCSNSQCTGTIPSCLSSEDGGP